MKTFLSIFAVLWALSLNAQNIIYFERLNNISNFSNGQGSVAVHLVGVSPTMQVLVKYDKLVSGNSVSTGWINYSGATYTDVYNSSFSAVGIYTATGDTILFSHQDFSLSNYEVTSIVTQGFDSNGQSNISGTNPTPWQVQVNFTGPDNNCDATISSLFGGNAASNNQLIFSGTNQVDSYYEPIYYNQFNSTLSVVIADTINILPPPPSYNSGSLLNAYIPRVINRPATASDCDGIVNFERVKMVSDATVQYAINNSPYSTLSTDQISNVCATDTIKIIGFSTSVLPNDTLFQTQYVIKNQQDPYASIFDISNVELYLNLNNPDSMDCLNQLFLKTNNSSDTYSEYGYISNEKAEFFLVPVNPTQTIGFDQIIGSLCQRKYTFNASASTFNSDTILNDSYFTFTILTENNVLNNNWYDISVTTQHTNISDCGNEITIQDTNNSGIIEMYSNESYSYQPDGYGENVFVSNNDAVYTNYSSDTSINMCKGIHLISANDRYEYHIITDSLQELKVNYKQAILLDPNHTGIYSQKYFIPVIDTIIHNYEECTNDYSLPFNTVLFDTNNLATNIYFDYSNANVLQSPYFQVYESNFNLTQNGNSITLPYREVMTLAYDSIPYYIIAELYCNAQKKSLQKRRRIVIHPNGQIEDIYGNAYSEINENLLIDPIKIYPNPVLNQLNILSLEDFSELNVFDNNGRILYSTKNLFKNSHIIETEFFPKGSYILEVISSKEIVRKHFVKM